MYHIVNLVALLAVLSSAALRLIKSGPSGTFHVTWLTTRASLTTLPANTRTALNNTTENSTVDQ